MVRNDLISRKSVIDILESIRLNDCNLSRRYTAADIQERVENVPTAYDVDAVISEINSCFDSKKEVYTEIDSDFEFGKAMAYQNAIEIVRNGGKKE